MPAQLLPLAHKMLGHAAYVIGAAIVAGVDFRNQVTTGSIVATAVVLALAGLFTVRSKIAKVWRDERDAERAAKERVQTDLAAALADRAAFDVEQHDLRHALNTDLATEKLKVQALEAKTDLTAALDAIRQMNEGTVATVSAAVSTAVAEAIRTGGSEKRDRETQALLEEIRDRMPPAATA